MNNNINLKILEFRTEIDKMQDLINNKMLYFVTKASELVELSEDMYQIEKTIRLNKISLKSYLLDSPCCMALNENNILDYTIDELKNYLNQYEQSSNEDCFVYRSAIALYELLEEIENLVDDKINFEIDKVSELEASIKNIVKISSSEYRMLYDQIKVNLNDNYLVNNLIDEEGYKICVQLLNDIFNFYISGYPDISEEFLYHENNNN